MKRKITFITSVAVSIALIFTTYFSYINFYNLDDDFLSTSVIKVSHLASNGLISTDVLPSKIDYDFCKTYLKDHTIPINKKGAKKIIKDIKKDAKKDIKDINKEAKKDIKSVKKEAKKDDKKSIKKEIKGVKKDVKKDIKDINKETKKDIKSIKKEAKEEIKDVRQIIKDKKANSSTTTTDTKGTATDTKSTTTDTKGTVTDTTSTTNETKDAATDTKSTSMKLFDRFNNTLVYNNVSHNLRPVADIIKGSKSAISAKSKLDAASSGKNVATELNTTEEVTKKATKDSSKSTTAKTANESEETTNDSKKEIASPAGAGESVKQSVVTPDVKSDNAATKSNVIGEATEKATKDSSKSTTAKTTSDTAEATKGKKSKGSDKKILKKYSNKMSVITKPLQSTLDTKKSTLSNLADLNLKDKKVNTVSNKKNTIAYTIPSGKKKISVKFLDSVCQKIVKANDKAVKDAKKKEANKNNDTTDETDDGTTDGTTDDTTTTELTADQQLLKKLQEDTSWTNIHTRDYDDRKVIVDIQYNPISKVEPHKPVDIGTKIYFRMIGSPNKADLANAITLNFDYSSCFKPISPSDIIIQDYVIAMASDQTYSSVKLYESTVAYVFPLEVYKAPINSRVCTSTIQISNGYSPIKLPINFFFKSSSDPSATSAKKIFDLEKGKDDYYEEIMALKDKHCELSCQAWLDHGSQVDKSTSYSEFITAVDAFKVFYATYAD